MERYEEVFFSLLRSGLWGTSPEIPEGFDEWGKVVQLAKTQSVLGIVGDVMLSDGTIASKLSPELKSKVKTFIMANMMTHGKINSVLADVVARLREEGIESVLLKGQGLAQNYPKPELRQCGDIDLYVGQENYDRTYDVLSKYATKIDDRKALAVGKHYHVSLGKVEVEVHRYSENYPSRKQDEKYQVMAGKGLNSDLVPIMFGSVKVNTPSDDYNAFFIFSHLFIHYLTTGIGIRQFCDWMLFLSARKDKIVKENLYKIIDEMDMMRPWQAFGCVLVNVLGMPKSDFPFYDESRATMQNKIVARVLSEGNFGKERGVNVHRGRVYLFNKSLSFLGHIGRTIELLFVFPKESLQRFAYTFINGFLAVWNDAKIRFGR